MRQRNSMKKIVIKSLGAKATVGVKQQAIKFFLHDVVTTHDGHLNFLEDLFCYFDILFSRRTRDYVARSTLSSWTSVCRCRRRMSNHKLRINRLRCTKNVNEKLIRRREREREKASSKCFNDTFDQRFFIVKSP